jgi:hypothetical protein
MKVLLTVGFAFILFVTFDVWKAMSLNHDRAFMYVGAIEKSGYVGSFTEMKNCKVAEEAMNQKYNDPKTKVYCSEKYFK